MTETRWNIRVPVEIDMEILLDDSTCLRGRTRDISFDGVFVRIDGAGLTRGLPVELVWGDWAAPFRGRARVARTDESGVAFAFFDADEYVEAALSPIIESGLCNLAYSDYGGQE